ncbi:MULTISPECIES: MFS transporter [unclassified Amycolatopsis]|uniref:MFS transporter n=1 Tax=unclassified Amycolatopsis TaxID=2618356 RepID=UPI002E1563F5|nr:MULTISPECIES: MFS transporter [unclassified Amycolatopsis]WSK77480.1 MFS transporter [Amycolatopsis sp. NBC_01286]
MSSPAVDAPKRTVAAGVTTALWLGLAVSLLGDSFYRVGLTWNATTDGGIGPAALLGTAMALPVALLGMFGGVVIDRFNRPGLMIVTDVVRFAVVAAFAVLFLGNGPGLPALLAGAAVLAASGVCFTPALQSWLPDLFPDRDRMIKFDALFLTTINVVGVVGPALAGALYPFVGMSGFLWFDAGTFAVSAVAVFYVRRALPGPGTPALAPPPEPPRPRRNLLADVREGLRYIFGNEVLRRQFTVFPFMEAAAYSLVFLLPSYLSAAKYTASWLFGALLAANAIGRVLGAWVFAHTGLRRRRGPVLAVNHLSQGVMLGLFVLVPDPVVGTAAFLLMGLPAGASQIALSSWVQTNVDRQFRGRAFGTLTSFVQWLMPLGPLFFGWLGALLDPRWAVVIIAATFFAGGAAIVSSRAVRSLQ